MSLLLALQLAPDPPKSTTGQLLRSSGIRRPWMPGVLAGPGADPVRATNVVQAPQPPLPGALTIQLRAPRDQVVVAADRLAQTAVITGTLVITLVSGSAQWTGRSALPEDIRWPARPAVVVAQPVPVPGANVEQLVAIRDQAVVTPDHTWPVAPIVGWQPIPAASFWMPSPARVPNTDPLRPPLIVTDPPDGTLVQPSAAWVGRLARSEDTSRPARPAIVQTGAQPLPGAQAQLVGIVHETPAAPSDRLPPGTALQVGAQPIPGASAVVVGRITSTPTDRLAPTAVIGGQPPLPGGRALWTFAPRDQVVVAADRLACTQVVSGQQPQPLGRALSIGVVHADDRALSRTAVQVGQQPQPGAQAYRVGAVLPAPTDRPAVTRLFIGAQPVPGARVLWGRAGLSDFIPDPDIPGPTTAALATSGMITAGLANAGDTTAALFSSGATTAALASDGHTTAPLTNDGRTTADL